MTEDTTPQAAPQNTSLKEEVKGLNDKFDQLLASGKVKGIKAKKLGKAEKKKNFIRYIFINENRDIKAVKVPVDEGVVWHGGVPRIGTTDYMLSWEGDPTIIQPGWSTVPFSPVQNYEEAVQAKMTAAGYRLLLKAIKEGEVKPKKKMSGALIFGIVIAIIVIGYLLLKK